MNVLRIVILVLAVVAAIVTGILVRNLVTGGDGDSVQTEVRPAVPTTEILVASGTVESGTILNSEHLRWQAWPEDAVSESFIDRRTNQEGLQNSVGSVARLSLASGEPVTARKVVKPGEKGFMAAVLRPGMRAVSVRVSPETGAGGFILPGDRVDVILSRKVSKDDQTAGPMVGGRSSETIMRDVRVLAIDQIFQQAGEQQSVVGRTATLELTLSQAEIVSVAAAAGTLHLALRSLVASEDGQSTRGDGNPFAGDGDRGKMTIIRHGYASRVSLSEPTENAANDESSDEANAGGLPTTADNSMTTTE